MPTYYLPIEPQPYVRRTHKGRFSDAAKRYHRWLEDAREAALVAGLKTLPDSGIHINFYISMPQSWSKTKRREYIGKGHGTEKGARKDLDNLTKALFDALRPKDDGNIYHFSACKQWRETGGIEVIIRERWEA